MQFHLPDPRAFPIYDSAQPNPLIDLALASLATELGVIQEKRDNELRERLATLLLSGNIVEIADALERSPTHAVLRHITRTLAGAHVDAGHARGDAALPSTVFAIPLVIVAANSGPLNVPGALPNIDEITTLMKGNGALRGNENFVLSNAMAPASAMALEKLPATLGWWSAASGAPIAIEKASLPVPANQESVFLRFLVGTALAGPGVDLLTANDTGKWGMPFTQAFAKQLGGGTLSLLAMPRPPRSPLAALMQGRAAQREVSMQLFATNAIRKFRASVGEPEAVISAHRTAGGGEVRLSLSNSFDEKGAEGFRAELQATDRAQDVAVLMADLLRECNVESVAVLADVFPDIDSESKLPMLFRADALEGAAEKALGSIHLH
ncbi:MAG: hypothetical protein ABIZ64_09360 [Casimicrobium sp.]